MANQPTNSARAAAEEPEPEFETDGVKGQMVMDAINEAVANDPTRFTTRSFAVIWNEGHSIRLINRKDVDKAISIPWEDLDALRAILGTGPTAPAPSLATRDAVFAELNRRYELHKATHVGEWNEAKHRETFQFWAEAVFNCWPKIVELWSAPAPSLAAQPFTVQSFVERVWKLTNDRYGWSRVQLEGLTTALVREFQTASLATAIEKVKAMLVTDRKKLTNEYIQPTIAGSVHTLEQVLAELTALQGEGPVDEWRPIGTAPTDGSEILVANNRSVKQVRWMISAAKARPDGGWFVGGYDGWALTWKPSHWMPLPTGPRGQQGDK